MEKPKFSKEVWALMRELEEMIIIPKCKYCGSAEKVVRFGRYKGV